MLFLLHYLSKLYISFLSRTRNHVRVCFWDTGYCSVIHFFPVSVRRMDWLKVFIVQLDLYTWEEQDSACMMITCQAVAVNGRKKQRQPKLRWSPLWQRSTQRGIKHLVDVPVEWRQRNVLDSGNHGIFLFVSERKAQLTVSAWTTAAWMEIALQGKWTIGRSAACSVERKCLDL